MIPPLIVETALKNGINLIAITDHNAGDNVPAVIKAAEGRDLAVLPGMELQTQEDVHILCLFNTIDQLNVLQSLVDENLPDIKNTVDYFGEQFIVLRAIRNSQNYYIYIFCLLKSCNQNF